MPILFFWIEAEIPLIFKAVRFLPKMFNAAVEDALSFRDSDVCVIVVVEFRFWVQLLLRQRFALTC